MSALADWLSGELVPIAWCWRIVRRDGAVLGLTTHDADLMVGGLLSRSAPGIRPTELVQEFGLYGDRIDIEGALTAAAIDAAELGAGRWDGATLSLYAADWSAPEAHVLLVAEGELGAVVRSGGQFTAQLRSLGGYLDAPAAPETRPTCRAELGDRACRVPMAGRVHAAEVVGAGDGWIELAVLPVAAERLVGGSLRWRSGERRGLRATIVHADGARLWLSMEQAGTAPARVWLTEGCDKRAATCRTIFANMPNFQGEPHLPGIDLLTRYPGG